MDGPAYQNFQSTNFLADNNYALSSADIRNTINSELDINGIQISFQTFRHWKIGMERRFSLEMQCRRYYFQNWNRT